MSPPRIITFYSYKGGVGRSMALANIAVILARRGRRVLCIDWDLEAAGLHRYFAGQMPPDFRPVRGLLDLVEDSEVTSGSVAFEVPRGDLAGSVDLIPAGNAGDDYVRRLQAFDWARAYEAGLGLRLESLREEWLSNYDLVLIDSRTGLSDIGGICTIQLPDILVMMFGANRQSLDGTLDVARRVELARRELPIPRSTLMILPLPSRFEGRTEVDQAQRWLQIFAEELEPLYANWLDASVKPSEILRYTRLPAIPRWSFEESLPVLVEDSNDPDAISYSMEAVAALIDRGLEGSAELVAERGSFVTQLKRWDFGLVVFNGGGDLCLRVEQELRGLGRTTTRFADQVMPGDRVAEVLEDFADRVKVIVGFFGGAERTNAEYLVEAAHRRGKRFVHVLADERTPAPAGTEGLRGVIGRTPTALAARLIDALDRPPRLRRSPAHPS